MVSGQADLSGIKQRTCQ